MSEAGKPELYLSFDGDIGLDADRMLDLQEAMVEVINRRAAGASAVDALFAALACACDVLQATPAGRERAELADRALSFVHRNCGAPSGDLVRAQADRVFGGAATTLRTIKPAGSA